jgi:hypothetical protein
LYRSRTNVGQTAEGKGDRGSGNRTNRDTRTGYGPLKRIEADLDARLAEIEAIYGGRSKLQ